MREHDFTPERPLYVEVGPLLTKHLTGVGRFIARLLEALAPRVPLRLVTCVDRTWARLFRLSTVLLVGSEIAVDPGALGRVDEDLAGWVRRLLRLRQRRHDPARAAEAPGLYTMLRPPGRHFRRELGILYDFTPLLLPWTHQKDTCESFGAFFAEASRAFDKVVAISDSTRADARWLCAVPPGDVVVGYPGPSMCVHRHSHAAPVRREDNTILVVSTLEPRKNGPFLVDWFFRTRALPPGTRLLWAGSAGWLCELARHKVLTGAGRTVELLGMVPDARLCELYRRATFTIYPSLYEGFGFPVLDSLRHGTPVLCGYHSSLQEFDGLGARFFDPCDAASLDEACGELLADLGRGRMDLVGPDELDRRFSWDRLAGTVLSLCA